MNACSLLSVMVAFGICVTSSEMAGSANLFELNFYLSGPRYEGDLPACDDDGVLRRISARMSEKEDNFWNSGLSVLAFESIRETAYRPGPPQSIPRRYCSAVVEVSDNVKRPVFYSIAEGSGMIGSVYGVEWCVVGLDRLWAYGPSCRAARP
jgi:hypothetical protein